MRVLLTASFVLILLASLFVLSEHQASAVPVSYNMTALGIPWTIQARNSSVIDIFVEGGYNGTITSWYHHTIGSNTIYKKLGSGLSSLTLLCNTASATEKDIVANGTIILYSCGSNPASINKIDINTGVNTHLFSINGFAGVGIYTFVTRNTLGSFTTDAGGNAVWASTVSGGNRSGGAVSAIAFPSSEKLATSVASVSVPWNSNVTNGFLATKTNNQCELTDIPNNQTTNKIDDIGCDISIPNHATKYYYGIYINKMNNYYTNSSLSLFNSINSNSHKNALTLTPLEYGTGSSINPYVSFILHDSPDQLVVMTSTNIYFAPISYVETLLSQNRAIQNYYTTVQSTTSNFEIPSIPIQSMINYGPSGNVTVPDFGMYTLLSGYQMKGSSIVPTVRQVDPRWTNDHTHVYPVMGTGSQSMFPIVLTISNAPLDGALWLANPSQNVQNVNSVWCITQLDTTHTAECDIPPQQCATVYVADISVTPTIWNYQGSVCATGTNQKTIADVNGLPLGFFSSRYGATSTFNPTNNGLSTTVRSGSAPFTYNVIIKNSTGAITQNFTKTINGTIDTHNFNLTNATKSAGVFISIPGTGQIYSSYVGSPLSLASAASFFHQYFSYQGFDLLSFIPIVFAAMFTRNNVGIGMALVVVCIATLNFLSVVVVPDIVVYISIIIAAIGMVGYRSLYY